MLKYSIIIPHKNCPVYLARLLESIPVREDIEVIIVDDNSDSKIVDFNNFPSINRKNIKLILTQDGKGAGFARNVGLECAKGEWILFADSDDFYEPDAFDEIDKNLSEELDVLYYTVSTRDSITLNFSQERRVIANQSVLFFVKYDSKSEMLLKFRNSAPWNKVIKRELIINNDIRFEEIEINNDVFFSLKLGLVTQKYKVIKKNLYCFTFRKDSISTKKRTVEKENLFLIMRIRINQFYKANGMPELKKSYLGIIYMILKKNGLWYFLKYIGYIILNFDILLSARKNWNSPELIKT